MPFINLPETNDVGREANCDESQHRRLELLASRREEIWLEGVTRIELAFSAREVDFCR